jgi:ATP-binding cassette subfamily B protein
MSEPQRGDGRLWRGLATFLRADQLAWVGALLLAPVTAIAVVLQPLLLQQVIDRHVVTGQIDGLWRAALLYLLAVLGGFVFQVAHTWLLSVAATRTITRVRRAVLAHLLSLKQRFFDQQPSGRLLTRATSDVEALGETLNAGAFTILIDALQVLGVLSAMLWLDARLTALLLLVVPPLLFVIELLRRKLRAQFNEIHTSQAALNAWTSERLEGVEAVQLLADEPRALKGFDDRLDRYARANIRSNLYDALLFATVDGVSAATMALMLWYGSGGALAVVVTPGVLAAFIDYVGKLFGPIQEFSQKLAVLQRAAAALEKIFSLLDNREQITGEHPPPNGPGRLTLRQVSFGYEPDRPVLHEIDLAIDPGQVIALVGRTGSGKSSICGLLTRSYDGYTGSIQLDGAELASLEPRQLRRRIGAVRQDAQLFGDSVRFNLSLGHPFDDEQILRAVRAMRAEGVVNRLGGLDGAIQQGGRNLSAGEAQLLALARIFLHDPPVVLLDEATASVDPATEALLQEATATLLASKTTLVIAHRLATVLHADRIVVLHDGRIAEQGTHAELAAAGGRYAELLAQQLQEDADARGAG